MAYCEINEIDGNIQINNKNKIQIMVGDIYVSVNNVTNEVQALTSVKTLIDRVIAKYNAT